MKAFPNSHHNLCSVQHCQVRTKPNITHHYQKPISTCNKQSPEYSTATIIRERPRKKADREKESNRAERERKEVVYKLKYCKEKMRHMNSHVKF